MVLRDGTPAENAVALRAACNCGWRAFLDRRLPDGPWRAEQIWRNEHMLPLCTLGAEPAGERIGRELVDRLSGFQHNLPFARTSPLEGLRAVARIREIADQAVHQLLALALRQGSRSSRSPKPST
ncbi:hypothetical protein [Kitasatospora purpeofusca]|uniref:hypothetical protein n=1 Tax=Kitasatospora purpeofusca TaxID=67352 RepID=UPI0037F15B8B